ncbi:MAG: hypothetical protein JW891_03215 [Candidatus Lokiarchaeota archaeon]|nr:hypothetical protein [Candidatus Lokiarchaeota archaeon]
MIPKKIVENLVNNHVFIYLRHIDKEFAGVIRAINESDLILLEDKNAHITYIPLSEIIAITERK